MLSTDDKFKLKRISQRPIRYRQLAIAISGFSVNRRVNPKGTRNHPGLVVLAAFSVVSKEPSAILCSVFDDRCSITGVL